MKKYLIGLLLHYANRDVSGYFLKYDFYKLKERILKEYGKPDGFDVQRIKKICTSCSGTGVFRCTWKAEEQCFSCSGTGIYEKRLVYLNRYKICGFSFHIPQKTLFGECSDTKGCKNIINGYVTHTPPKFKLGRISAFILFFLFDKRKYRGVDRTRAGSV